MGELAELERLIEEGYERAIQAISRGGKRRTSLFHYTGQELDTTSRLRSTVTKVDILDEWKILIEKMKEHEHFIEYTGSLRHAFHDFDHTDPEHFVHLKTLVALLAHTVEHKNRDNSTECRFVTLLEVMMSYGRKWRPSEQVSRFWVRLMQKVPSDITPVNFRRKAYRVLVSLDWVPSSKGLLAACSFEESKQSLATDKAVPGIRSILSRIRGDPLPRFDCVNQMLDRLKDETDVCVGITSGREGIGKSTLAMLVASHPSIQRVFKVLWLPMADSELDYEWYLGVLNDLCQQLGVKQEWPKNVRRFEEDAIRQLREESIMQKAKATMSQLLIDTDENILLILDDVVDHRQIEWCRFNERQSIIVTTGESELQGVDWYVTLDPFSEEEALDLFMREAHFPDSHIAGSTVEIRAIVNQCKLHPLSIRTVARWFHLKRITAGALIAAEELKEDLAACQPELEPSEEDETEFQEPHPSAFLFNVLSMMMGPARTKGDGISDLFVIFLAAFVVVFPDKVPFDCALLLWEQLLRLEPRAVEELGPNLSELERKKHTWLIAEGLNHMGLITVTEESNGSPMVQVHHHEYAGFARMIAQGIDAEENFEAVEQEWHKAFVTIYFAERIQSVVNGMDEKSWTYGLEKLPSHIIKARMKEMAEAVLTDEHFLESRVEEKGWEEAMKLQVNDCVQLQMMLDEEDESTDDASLSSPLFTNVSIVMKKLSAKVASSDVEKINQICYAAYRVGFALIELGYFSQAVGHFEDAIALLPQSTYIRASLLYGLGCALLASEKGEKALQKIDAAVRLMEEMDDEHDLYKEVLQLKADALVANYSYRTAHQFFTDVSRSLRSDLERNALELGSFLIKKGRLHHMLGEFEQSRDDLNESISLKTSNGEMSRSLAFAYSALGDVFIDRQLLHDAREQFEKAVEVLDETGCDPQHPDYLLSLGKLHFLQNDKKGCLALLEEALETVSLSPIIFLDQSAYDLRMISRIYRSYGDLPTAVEILKDSLELTENKDQSLERAAAFFDMASILLQNDQKDEGLVFLLDCYRIRREKLESSHQVIDTMCKIGSTHFALGSFAESLHVYEEGLDIVKQSDPTNGEKMSEIMYYIAEVLEAQGKSNEAVETLKSCVETAKSRKSEGKHIAAALEKMGEIYANRNELQKSSEVYLEAIQIRESKVAYEPLAEDRLRLARVFARMEKFDFAEDQLLDSFDNWNSTGNSRGSCDTIVELAKLYRLQSKFVKALDILQKALKMPWDRNELKSRVYLALGHVFLSQGKFLDALKAYQKAQSIRIAEFGENDQRTGDAFRSMALANYLLNRGDEALILFNEYVRIHDAEEKPEGALESVDYVLVMVLVGDLLTSKSDVDMAQNMWNIAQDVVDEDPHFKQNHPMITHMVQKRREKKQPSNGNSNGDVIPTEYQKKMLSAIEAGETELFGQDPSEVAMMRMHPFVES